MREPVRLSTSGKVMERAVALQCVLRGGKDPFTGSKLTAADLVPDLELAEKIAAWKQKKSEADISLNTQEVNTLINDLVVDQDVLSALVEAEQIGFMAKRALIDATEGRDESDIIDETRTTEHPEREELVVSDESERVLRVESQESEEEEFTSHRNVHLECRMPLEEPKGFESRHWGENSARVLEISKPKASVTMNVPGSGVRPFYFVQVNNVDANQEQVRFM